MPEGVLSLSVDLASLVQRLGGLITIPLELERSSQVANVDMSAVEGPVIMDNIDLMFDFLLESVEGVERFEMALGLGAEGLKLVAATRFEEDGPLEDLHTDGGAAFEEVVLGLSAWETGASVVGFDLGALGVYLGEQVGLMFSPSAADKLGDLGPLSETFANKREALVEMLVSLESVIDVVASLGDGLCFPPGFMDDPAAVGLATHGADPKAMRDGVEDFFGSLFVEVSGLQLMGIERAPGSSTFDVSLDAEKYIRNLETDGADGVHQFVQKYGDRWQVEVTTDEAITHFTLPGVTIEPGTPSGFDFIAEVLAGSYPYFAHVSDVSPVVLDVLTAGEFGPELSVVGEELSGAPLVGELWFGVQPAALVFGLRIGASRFPRAGRAVPK